MAPVQTLAPRWIRPIAVCAALSLAGCSFMVSGPPSYTPPHAFPSCDEEITLPTIDLAWASLYLLGGTTAVFDAGSDEATGVLVAAALGMALFGGAAMSGFSKARACSQARDEYRARYQLQQQQPQLPGGAQPTPFGPPSSVPRAPY